MQSENTNQINFNSNPSKTIRKNARKNKTTNTSSSSTTTTKSRTKKLVERKANSVNNNNSDNNSLITANNDSSNRIEPVTNNNTSPSINGQHRANDVGRRKSQTFYLTMAGFPVKKQSFASLSSSTLMHLNERIQCESCHQFQKRRKMYHLKLIRIDEYENNESNNTIVRNFHVCINCGFHNKQKDIFELYFIDKVSKQQNNDVITNNSLNTIEKNAQNIENSDVEPMSVDNYAPISQEINEQV